ncbi:IS4 family transposase [Bacillus sp. SCS-153A]|uniref:IS4 family transposase n=1 Tax=Rossellomorea sedimentorum TaxID=3115294 RepID=UPI003906609A
MASLTNFNKLSEVLQTFITDEEVENLCEEWGYHDTARKFSAKDLVRFFVISSAKDWKSFRDAETKMPQEDSLPSVDHSTLAKKAQNVPYQILQKLFSRLVNRLGRGMRRALFKPYKLFAVDSTTITFQHPDMSWAGYTRTRHAIRLHTKFDVEEGQPTQVIHTTGRHHDVMVAPKLYEDTEPLSIITADRGYARTKDFEDLHEDHQFFVIRVASSFSLSEEMEHSVPLDEEGNVKEDLTAFIGKRTRKTKYRFRLVTFTDNEGNKIKVATNLIMMSPDDIAYIYKLRWQIELFFRWVKGNLDLSNLFGNSPNSVYSQVYGTLIGYFLLRWIYNETKEEWAILHSFTFIEFTRRYVAYTLPVEVRCAVKSLFQRRGSLCKSAGKI